MFPSQDGMLEKSDPSVAAETTNKTAQEEELREGEGEGLEEDYSYQVGELGWVL